MSESVKILIEADDQASGKFNKSADAIEKAERRVEQVMNSLKSPIERYNDQIKELESLHNSGKISAEKFAAAQTALKGKITELEGKVKDGGNAFKEMGGRAKSTTEFVGVLASLTGNSALAGYAGQLAQVTEKAGAFSEVSKAGGAGALAFKLGLVGLVGTIAVGFGKALGDVIFQTEKFNREMEAAKQTALEMAAAVAKNQQQRLGNRREDIELIQDPEKKRAAQKQLLEELNRDISAVTANVNNSKQLIEQWADSWKIAHGWNWAESKAAADMAQVELDKDKARLAALKEQRAELVQITSVRAQNNEELRKANAEQDRSESYIENLKLEVEYLRATKEEQLALDAARNTTEWDRSEAEQLLRERDALIAKAEAAKELEEVQKRADEERKRQDEQKKQQLENEIKRVKDLEKAEQQRLELRRIEIEQGKEAAKVQALVNQGLNREVATRIAAEEARLDAIQNLGGDKADKTGLGKQNDSALKAVEGRLLTRGPGSQKDDHLKTIASTNIQLTVTAEKMLIEQAMMVSEMRILKQKLENNDNVMLEPTT